MTSFLNQLRNAPCSMGDPTFPARGPGGRTADNGFSARAGGASAARSFGAGPSRRGAGGFVLEFLNRFIPKRLSPDADDPLQQIVADIPYLSPSVLVHAHNLHGEGTKCLSTKPETKTQLTPEKIREIVCL